MAINKPDHFLKPMVFSSAVSSSDEEFDNAGSSSDSGATCDSSSTPTTYGTFAYDMWKGRDFNLYNIVKEMNAEEEKKQTPPTATVPNTLVDSNHGRLLDLVVAPCILDVKKKKKYEEYPQNCPVIYFPESFKFLVMHPDLDAKREEENKRKKINRKLAAMDVAGLIALPLPPILVRNLWKAIKPSNTYDWAYRGVKHLNIVVRIPFLDESKRYRQKMYWVDTLLKVRRDDLISYYNEMVCLLPLERDDITDDWTPPPFVKIFQDTRTHVKVEFSCRMRRGNKKEFQLYDICLYLFKD